MEQEKIKEVVYLEDGRQVDFSSIVVNQDNSTPEELKINTYPIEIQEQFMDFLCNVPFIQNCISIDKPRACDMPKDEQGKIIINIGEVHHLEDMDYFRPTAIHFQKTGKVTNLRPNANPNSEFGKWFKEEIRRCWEGYIRKSDGEWITGDMYFFLNYCPIMQSKVKMGSKKALRIWDFPEFWEGHYYKFHYADQARANGLHGAELAARGRGKALSYDEQVLTPEGFKQVKDIKVGDALIDIDGNCTFVAYIPFDDYCDVYTITLEDDRKIKASSEHLFYIKLIDYDNKLEQFTISSVSQILSGIDRGYQVEILPNKFDKGMKHLIKSIEPYKEGEFTNGKGQVKSKCFFLGREGSDFVAGNYITTHNSYSLAAMIAKRFILGETRDTTREVKSLVTAYQKEYLNRDGVLNKFQSYVDFCAQNTQFPSQKLKNSLNEMQWTMGYFDLDTQTRKGTLNEVLGVSSKDDDSKLRGKRSSLIGIEEFEIRLPMQ